MGGKWSSNRLPNYLNVRWSPGKQSWNTRGLCKKSARFVKASAALPADGGPRPGEQNVPIQHELMSPRARVSAPPHEGWRAPTRALRTTETAAAPTTARAPAAATASPYPDHHHAFGPTPVTRGMPPRGGCGRCRKHSPTVNVVAIPQRTPRSGRNRSLDLMGGRGRRVAASLRR